MATADLITELNTDLNNAYTSIANKGGTVPENKNSNNLASAIDSIPAGSGGEDEPYVPFVPEFDGGEWGTIAYLDSNNEVQYYSCPSNPMSKLSSTTGTGVESRVFYTLENGEEISNSNVVAFAFGDQISSVSYYFMSNCYNLRNLYFGNVTLTGIGNYFLDNCRAFNQPLTIPDTVTGIGNHFLSGCHAFNQPLTIPATVTKIDTYFLSGCYDFNQPLTIPATVTKIDNNFLSGCYDFNQPLTIPATVTSIGSNFLSNCYAFNQPLTIPATVTSIGNYFLYSMGRMTKTITIETSAAASTSNLTAVSSTAEAYKTGITLAGSGAAAWKAALPDRTTNPYRKLILEEEAEVVE